MYKDIFCKRHTFLAVIHTVSFQQALKNVQIAFDGGCDGPFLINHSIFSKELIFIYKLIREKFDNHWIGLNLLGERLPNVFNMIPESVNGLWIDNAEIICDKRSIEKLDSYQKTREISKFHGLYFGGVAFKYQEKVENLSQVSELAKNYMDVLTTSGDATGSAPAVEKIQTIRNAVNDFPIAIASGITPENVTQFKNIADCFLVATGISCNFENLDENKVKALRKNLDE